MIIALGLAINFGGWLFGRYHGTSSAAILFRGSMFTLLVGHIATRLIGPISVRIIGGLECILSALLVLWRVSYYDDSVALPVLSA